MIEYLGGLLLSASRQLAACGVHHFVAIHIAVSKSLGASEFSNSRRAAATSTDCESGARKGHAPGLPNGRIPPYPASVCSAWATGLLAWGQHQAAVVRSAELRGSANSFVFELCDAMASGRPAQRSSRRCRKSLIPATSASLARVLSPMVSET